MPYIEEGPMPAQDAPVDVALRDELRDRLKIAREYMTRELSQAEGHMNAHEWWTRVVKSLEAALSVVDGPDKKIVPENIPADYDRAVNEGYPR